MKMIIKFCIILVLLFITSARAQSQFQLRIPGTYIYSITNTTDGGFIAVGTNVESSISLLKFDINGKLIWNKPIKEKFFGSISFIPKKIIQTNDGGFAIACYRSNTASFCMMKVDINGNVQWLKSFGSAVPNSIIETSGNEFILVGYIPGGYSRMYIVKIDSLGTYQWNKRIEYGDANSVINTSDGGYAVLGYKTFFSPSVRNDVILIKFDAEDKLQWCRTIGGNFNERGMDIIQSLDGGFAIAGISNSFISFYDAYIIKLNAIGELEWDKAFGGIKSDYANSIIQTADSSYIIAATSTSFRGEYADILITKLNSFGDIQLCMSIGEDTTIGSYWANSVIQVSDGGYVFAGSTTIFGIYSDGYIIKLDSSFNTCGYLKSRNVSIGSGGISSITNLNVDSFNPTLTSVPTISDIEIMPQNICSSVGIHTILNEIPNSYELEQNYPNPFNPSTVINYSLPFNSKVTLRVFNILGKEVASIVNERQNAGKYSVEFNGEGLSSGVYYYELRANEFVSTKRMVFLK